MGFVVPRPRRDRATENSSGRAGRLMPPGREVSTGGLRDGSLRHNGLSVKGAQTCPKSPLIPLENIRHRNLNLSSAYLKILCFEKSTE